MAWQQFKIESYSLCATAHNTLGYPEIYGFIRLSWQGAERATLWFYRDAAGPIAPNVSFMRGHLYYYGRFGQAQFADCVDLLRNENPVFLHWNDATLGVFLATGSEPVGEGDTP